LGWMNDLYGRFWIVQRMIYGAQSLSIMKEAASIKLATCH
jgi:hypothetical protein